MHRSLPIAALLIWCQSAAAKDAGGLTVELNTLDQVDGACRLTFTLDNDTGQDIGQAVYETVLFDTAGGVAELTLFDFREAPAGRLRVRQFDLADTDCAELGGFLLNDAATCTVAGAASDVCDRAQAASRTAVEALQ